MGRPQKAQPGMTDWRYVAFRLWCKGTRNYTEILRALNAENDRNYGQLYGKLPKGTSAIRQAIAKESKRARADMEENGVDEYAEYIAGLEEDFADADKLLRTAKNPNAAIAALKHKTTIRQMIAAAKGVVTERKAVDAKIDATVTSFPMPVFSDSDPLNHFAAGGGAQGDDGADRPALDTA